MHDGLLLIIYLVIKYFIKADSVKKSKCVKLCEENYWMPSLPNVNDFDWLREQFVNKEYFQVAGGMSCRKQLKHTTGKCWTVQCILDAQIPKRNPNGIDFIARIRYYRVLYFQQK